MKRSEAVQLILETFEFQGLGPQMREKDAYMILDALVRAGMKPPLTKRCPVLLTDKHVWEKED